MLTATQINSTSDLSRYFDLAFRGESVFVPRQNNQNVVIISAKEYADLQKAQKRAEYLSMLDNSFKQLETGDVVVKSLEELRAMEK